MQIKLLDGYFGLVASGVGELRKRVEPGLYVVEISSGTDEKQQTIIVRPDRPYEDFNLSLPVESAAPLQGLAAFGSEEIAALAELSRVPSRTEDRGARLVIFVRNPPTKLEGPIDLSRLSLRDSQIGTVVDLGSDPDVKMGAGWAGFSIDLSPGGYSLHWREKKHSRWTDRGRSVDQSLWIQENWITAVFLATNPHRDFAPRMTGMSIHMRRIDSGFSEDLESGAARINVALELALSGLRTGIPMVPRNLLDVMLYGKYTNPMLGIIGAHAILQSSRPQWSLFDEVVRNLTKLVPDHPDVVALRLVGKLKRRVSAMTRSEPMTWPPMVYDGYRGLIDRDWAEAGLIAMGSMADLASAHLLPHGPWTAWSSLDETPLVSRVQKWAKTESMEDRVKELAQSLLMDIKSRRRKSTIRRRQTKMKIGLPNEAVSTESALRRMRSFLAEQQEEEPESSMTLLQLGRMGMPMSSVARALIEVAGVDEAEELNLDLDSLDIS